MNLVTLLEQLREQLNKKSFMDYSYEIDTVGTITLKPKNSTNVIYIPKKIINEAVDEYAVTDLIIQVFKLRYSEWVKKLAEKDIQVKISVFHTDEFQKDELELSFRGNYQMTWYLPLPTELREDLKALVKKQALYDIYLTIPFDDSKVYKVFTFIESFNE